MIWVEAAAVLGVVSGGAAAWYAWCAREEGRRERRHEARNLALRQKRSGDWWRRQHAYNLRVNKAVRLGMWIDCEPPDLNPDSASEEDAPPPPS